MNPTRQIAHGVVRPEARPRDRRSGDRRSGDRRHTTAPTPGERAARTSQRRGADRRRQQIRLSRRSRRGSGVLLVILALFTLQLPVSATGDLIESWIVTFDAPPTVQDLEVLEGVAVDVHGFENLPAAVVDIDVLNVSLLEQLPGVVRAWPNDTYDLLLRESTTTIQAPTAWAAGWTGAGVGVAIVDAGVDGSHPDLCADEIFCLGNPVKTVQNVKFLGREARAEPVVWIEDLVTTDTGSGHGSHVAGIAAGAGVAGQVEPDRYRGVAPDASIIGLGVGDAVEAVNVLAAFDWILSNADTYNIKVVNNSWGPGKGTPYEPDHPVNVAASIMADHGIAVVFGAGNDGPVTDTLNAFSAHPDSFSAAGGNKAGDIAFFSSRGVPGSDLWAPDVTAPGYQIVSVRSTTGFYGSVADATSANYSIDPLDLPRYATSSGTSMASPHVAGAIAVIQQAAMEGLGRYLSVDELHNVIRNTANHDGIGGNGGMPEYQGYTMGAGYLNVAAAAAAANAGTDLGPWDDGLVYDVRTFAGTVGPALVVPIQSFDTTIDVLPGATSLNVMADWTVASNDIDIELFRPDGSLARSTFLLCGGDAAEPNGYSSFCSNIANERITVVNPAEGTWRASIRGGLANTSEDVVGAWSVTYPDGTAVPAGQQAATITLAADPAVGLQVTGSDIGLTATVTDANGVPIAGAPLTWSSTGVGEIVAGEVESHAAGWAMGLARSHKPGTQTVTVTSGSASATIALTWVGVELPPLPDPDPDPEPEPEPTPGRAAGGGWLLNNGVKASFGFFGEYAAGDAAPSGELSFDDRQGTKAHADHVTGFQVAGTTATLTGPAEVNGQSGWTYTLTVDDRGEPGRDNDTFHLVLTDPDGQVTEDVSGTLGGGNVQVEP